MKIEGADLAIAQKEFLITRPGKDAISLLCTAIPYGFNEQIEKEIPDPIPRKKGFMKDVRNRVLKDPETRKPMIEYDDETPDFKAREARINRLQSIYMIHEALKSDPRISFEAQRDKFETTEDWASAIDAEFRAAGFSIGEMTKLLTFVCELSGMSKEQIDEVKESFLSATA